MVFIVRACICAYMASVVATFLFVPEVHASDNKENVISVVGSSTVFPYSQVVAEQFNLVNKSGAVAVVESNGTGSGFKMLCNSQADIADASRNVKKSEIKLCADNGITDLEEVKIGYDGIAIAYSRKQKKYDWSLSKKDIYMALASKIPSEDGKGLVVNTYKTWNEVNPDLPKKKILFFGPPSSSGTRDTFIELVMIKGCEQHIYYSSMKNTLSSKAYKNKIKECGKLRSSDGTYVPFGENDNALVKRVSKEKYVFGIVGFGYVEENRDILEPVKLNGVVPSQKTIQDASYPATRPLFIYYRKSSVKDDDTALSNFLNMFGDMLSHDSSYGDALYERGLIALGDDELAGSIAKLTGAL
mgnify:CR=1 FL=1